MARWGKVDFRDLKKLQKRMQKFEEVDSDAFCRKVANILAQRLLKRVKLLTPYRRVVNTNKDLVNSWKVSEIVEVGSNTYQIEVYNSQKYASYVEFGHRQQPGKFIPGYWEGGEFRYVEGAKEGMVLKVSWVKGAKMLTKSEMEIENKKDRIIEKMLLKELNEVFSDD